MPDLFERRREFAVAVCRDLGLDPSQVTRLSLRFEQDGSVWADATVIPRAAFGDATTFVKTFGLFGSEVVELGPVIEKEVPVG